jgi:hypothetical protein
MGFRARICVYCGVIAMLYGGGIVYLRWPAKMPELIAPHARKPAFRSTPILVENEMTMAKHDIEERAVALLLAGKYPELDLMASEFRKNQTQFANGYWKLTLFYAALCDLETEAPEGDWQNRIDLLQHWFEEDPDSITPRVAFARGLVVYAWHARGNSWAWKVPSDAWPLVYERVAQAKRILEAARNLPEKCPYWYTTWMTAALLGRVSRQEYDEVYDEGIKNFPTYAPLYFAKVWYLQERWFGTRGEWEKFAAECGRKFGRNQNDILYAQIVWFLHDQHIFGDPIAESGADWFRVRRGFDAMRRRYPHSIFVLSEYCSLSGYSPAEARKLMHGLFQEVNNRVDLHVWRTMDRFLRNKRWAYAEK